MFFIYKTIIYIKTGNIKLPSLKLLIIIIVILLSIACSITDILYIGFNNEDKVDMKKELAYYNTEYKKDEAKNFFESVWEFVEKIFGGGEMTDKTDWPVKRTI